MNLVPTSTPARAVATTAAAAAAAQWLPSVVSLGQWLPIRTTPGAWCRWRGSGNQVALTFDDGPDPRTTPAVLDTLDRLALTATFFCLGDQVARWPDLVRETVRRGHQVASHGYCHAHHLRRGPRWIGRDVDASIDVLRDTGVVPRWFRPPYGQVSGASMLAARSRRLQLVLWSAWGREWAAPDAGAVSRRVINALTDGAIVLLHDSDSHSPPGSAAKAIAALEPIADSLHRLGLRAVSLDDLTAPGRIVRS